MRSIVVLLLLVIFFLAGTVFGIKSEDIAFLGDENNEQTEVVEKPTNTINPDTKVENEPVVEEKTTTYLMNTQEPVNFTQKTASFLEGGVQVFYNIVVSVLYQISQLFY